MITLCLGLVIMALKQNLSELDFFFKYLCSDLVLKRVVNVEKKTKPDVGSRYLLEMEMEDKEGKNFLISKYFYTTRNERYPELPGLCSPTDFAWKPEVKVHVIVTGQK